MIQAVAIQSRPAPPTPITLRLDWPRVESALLAAGVPADLLPLRSLLLAIAVTSTTCNLRLSYLTGIAPGEITRLLGRLRQQWYLLGNALGAQVIEQQGLAGIYARVQAGEFDREATPAPRPVIVPQPITTPSAAVIHDAASEKAEQKETIMPRPRTLTDAERKERQRAYGRAYAARNKEKLQARDRERKQAQRDAAKHVGPIPPNGLTSQRMPLSAITGSDQRTAEAPALPPTQLAPATPWTLEFRQGKTIVEKNGLTRADFQRLTSALAHLIETSEV